MLSENISYLIKYLDSFCIFSRLNIGLLVLYSPFFSATVVNENQLFHLNRLDYNQSQSFFVISLATKKQENEMNELFLPAKTISTVPKLLLGIKWLTVRIIINFKSKRIILPYSTNFNKNYIKLSILQHCPKITTKMYIQKYYSVKKHNRAAYTQGQRFDSEVTLKFVFYLSPFFPPLFLIFT